MGEKSIVTLKTSQGYRLKLPRGRIPYQEGMIRETGEYEPETTRAIFDFVKPGMRIAECGACCGYHAINLSKATGARGKVFCFEANQELIPLLSGNLRANGCGDNTEVINKGVWKANDTLQFPIFREALGMASLKSFEPDGKNRSDLTLQIQPGQLDRWVSLEVVSLDEHFADEPIDFLRMDIEGAEMEALQGAQHLLRAPGFTIIMESTPENTEKAWSDWLFNHLTAKGFRLYRILSTGYARIARRSDFHSGQEDTCRSGQRDVLCVKRDLT
jgi:FkbM family methyltransferase